MPRGTVTDVGCAKQRSKYVHVAVFPGIMYRPRPDLWRPYVLCDWKEGHKGRRLASVIILH